MRAKTSLFLPGITILFLCSVFLFPVSISSAQNARDEYKKIQRDLRQHKKKLAEATRTEKSVLGDLQRVQSQINDLDDQMNATKKQIQDIKGKISVLESEIAVNSKSLESQKGNLRKRLRTLQRINAEKEAILILISGEDSAKALRISRYLSDISNRYNEAIKSYRSEVLRLSDKKKKLDALAQNLKSEESSLARLEDSAMAKKKEKEVLLAGVRKEKDTYQRMINELKDNSERVARMIRESERREKPAPSGKKKTARNSRRIAEDLPRDSAFTKMKGHLPWPVHGNIALRYGSQVDPIFNLPVFRSGIHIKAARGTNVTSVADGQVVFASEFKGYGKLVVISHGGGYHTLYGNLEKIFLQNGAIIKENQSIGEVGESTALGTSGLYFELRYKGKPLDPQQWLRRSGG